MCFELHNMKKKCHVSGLACVALRVIDFKWIQSSSTFVLPHFMSSLRKEEMESAGGGSSCICVMSASVCNVN